MRLSKLEIYGFKSFAKRTEIIFPQNVTGIVGPNGSGKSNIADAVRWVLGEQSAKTLRGNSMPDIGEEQEWKIGLGKFSRSWARAYVIWRSRAN